MRIGYQKSTQNIESTGNGSGIIGFLIKSGVVKNRDQANLLLLASAIVMLFFAFLIFSSAENAADFRGTQTEGFDPLTGLPETNN